MAAHPDTGSLRIVSTANQDSLKDGHLPLLGIDVWEHAYYSQYGPARANYLKKIWDIVNWNYVEELYQDAHKQMNISKK